MTGATTDIWLEANQRYLTAALAVVRAELERHAARVQDTPASDEQAKAAQAALQEASHAMPAPPALETLCATFGLSPFERDTLLLCAGMEMDARFGPLCARAHGDPARPYPTFSLAMAALPDPHWSALTPAAPLRRWRLVEAGAGGALTLSPLRIDERVLHYLAGVSYLDERLLGFVEPVTATEELAPSHRALAERLTAGWSRAAGRAPLPVVELCGVESGGKRAVAAAACAALGLNVSRMPGHVIPTGPADLEALLRLWEREAALSSNALLLDCEEADFTDAARAAAITHLVERLNSPLIVATRERRPSLQRPAIILDVRKPTTGEQRHLWQRALGAAGRESNEPAGVLVSQFSLSAAAIRSASAEALNRVTLDSTSADGLDRALWEACRAQARPRLDDLAQRLEPAASWDDLVLPAAQRHILRDIVAQVRQRAQVYEAWGFAARSARGLGLSALFVGPSGTGKTMAAEVLANELRLDLYRIDLSQVVSKYIGETEKNLRRVFDAAEDGGAILLFDEAEALFGKRSEVKDSHDRYANIEIGYLLQRMEAYRGLAILTTNMKEALDQAFLRRLRFVAQFPFPDAAQRAEIWRRIFPPETPTEGLDVSQLTRLNVTGGNIRNIALYAAFLAADAGQPVRMTHLLRAAQVEYAKLERPLTKTEFGSWA